MIDFKTLEDEKAYAREHMRILYRKRLDAGMCQYCGKNPYIEGRKYCAECARVRRERYRRRRMAGLCMNCGKPSNGAFRCAECAQKDKERAMRREKSSVDAMKRLKERRRAAGQCIYCGREYSDAEGHISCTECRAWRNTYHKRYYAEKIRQGKCVHCSNKPVKAGWSYCAECLEKFRICKKRRAANGD